MTETITLGLTGLDGNAFAIIGRFRSEARRAGWTNDQMEEVTKEAMNGDYDHLLQTFMSHDNIEVS